LSCTIVSTWKGAGSVGDSARPILPNTPDRKCRQDGVLLLELALPFDREIGQGRRHVDTVAPLRGGMNLAEREKGRNGRQECEPTDEQRGDGRRSATYTKGRYTEMIARETG
jgi:hypothetical protein